MSSGAQILCDMGCEPAVLSFLKIWAPAEKLTLKQLTFKLVTLAALTSAARSSSVHRMDLHFRHAV